MPRYGFIRFSRAELGGSRLSLMDAFEDLTL